MNRPRWKYIVVPREFYDRTDIPPDSTIWKRYPQLLGTAWEETGSQYAYSTASNDDLGRIWGVSPEAARKTLAEMRDLEPPLIETRQIGRTGRLIKILVAYRGQGQDSARETNAPRQSASRMEAHPHASVAQAQPKIEDGRSAPTLDDSANSSRSVFCSESDFDRSSSTTSTIAAEKILQAANVRTVDLDLSEMDEERAQAIADYIAENPDGKNSPAGFAYACLRNNPDWQPPQPSKPVHWYAKYSHLVAR